VSDEPERDTVAHCTQCGAELVEGDRFCGKCGHQVGISAPEPPPMNGLEVRPTKSRTLWIAAAIVITVILVGVVTGGIVMAQNRAASERSAKRAAQARQLRSVYEKVAAVDSAVSVGINFQAYSAKVQDAQAARDTYTAPDAQTAEIVAVLDAALADYKSANTTWNDGIQSTYSDVDESALQEQWALASESMVVAREKLEDYEKQQ